MPITRKQPVVETVPDAFACFMRHVAELIDHGDLAAKTESDDLLQTERAYGGLYDSENGKYGFAYFVDDDADIGICWYFDLDREQIRDIAAGRLRQMQMWKCEGHDCGRRFPHADYYCEECDAPPE